MDSYTGTMLRPPSGWASLIVLTLMLLSVAWLVQALAWTEGLGVLTPSVLLAVLAGTVLGRLLWMPGTLAHGWSMVLGIAATLFLGSFTLLEFAPDPTALAELPRLEQMTQVRDLFMEWLALAINGESVPADLAQFVFVLWMAMLLWLVSYVGAWFLARYVNWWGAVLPAGFALLANIYHAPSSYLTYMAFFLLCAFVLAIQSHSTLQMDEWRQQRINYSPDIGFAFLRDGLLVAIVVLGLAWLAPVELSQSPLRTALARATQRGALGEEFNRLFPSLRYPARGGGTAFGTEMALGGSISLGTQPVFDAEVSGVPEGFEPRYWRLAVFDTYTGSGWRRTVDSVLTTDGDWQRIAAPVAATTPVTQTITLLRNHVTQLAALPQPLEFSLRVAVELSGVPQSPDVLTIDSVDSLGVGDAYATVSRMSSADKGSLRGALTDDPAWLSERYTQLTAGVPDRVVELAIDVTRDRESRFEKADAIEDYLRTYEYSDAIPTPPVDRDLVDWFLFDAKRGYCDYYASAFVVMARSIGIPSRMAAGYATGQMQAESGVYRQTEADAHTWPEVYFPEFGWIEFEPTASALHPEISRPEQAAATDRPPRNRASAPLPEELLPEERVPQGLAPTDSGVATQGAGLDVKAILLPSLLLLALAGGAAAISYSMWNRPLVGLTAAQAAYSKLARVAHWLGIGHRIGETPFEYGDRIADSVPESREDVNTITAAYVGERFGRRPSGDRAQALGSAWANLRTRLVHAGARLGTARVRAIVGSTETDAERQSR
jgi:transglutaminase-like putative cysteine protease